jgi:hypothetical protein
LAAAKKSRQTKLLHNLESASSLMKEDSGDTSPHSYSVAGQSPLFPHSNLGDTSTSSFNSRTFKLNVRKFMHNKVKPPSNKLLIAKIKETVHKIVDKQV